MDQSLNAKEIVWQGVDCGPSTSRGNNRRRSQLVANDHQTLPRSHDLKSRTTRLPRAHSRAEDRRGYRFAACKRDPK